jgi:hypothetical protein
MANTIAISISGIGDRRKFSRSETLQRARAQTFSQILWKFRRYGRSTTRQSRPLFPKLSATGMSALCDKPTFAQLFCVAGDQASEMAVHRLSSEVHHKAIVLSPTLLEIAFYFPSTLSIRLSIE